MFTNRVIPKKAHITSVENHFEELERVWDDVYKSRYGYWRPYIMTVIYRYLDCGDLHMGFARVRCENCGHEYLLALACRSNYTSFVLGVTLGLEATVVWPFLNSFFLSLNEASPGFSKRY